MNVLEEVLTNVIREALHAVDRVTIPLVWVYMVGDSPLTLCFCFCWQHCARVYIYNGISSLSNILILARVLTFLDLELKIRKQSLILTSQMKMPYAFPGSLHGTLCT